MKLKFLDSDIERRATAALARYHTGDEFTEAGLLKACEAECAPSAKTLAGDVYTRCRAIMETM